MRNAIFSTGVVCALMLAIAAHAVSFTGGDAGYLVGDTPLAVVAADLNGDGKPDIATANNDTGDVTVLLNDGTGNFPEDTTISYPIGGADLAGPSAIAVGDFNGDNLPDLVVTDDISNTVAVLLNQGGGVFGTPIITDTGMEPEALAIGDFDHDNHLDVATANYLDFTVTILLGTNNGSFSSNVTTITVDEAPDAIVAGNFNKDTNLDLVVANSGAGAGGTGTITVLNGKGDGSFTAVTPDIDSAALEVPVALAAADLNHDSNLDFVALNECGATVAVFLGNGDLTFQPATQFDVGDTPEGLVLADLDGDGNLDIASSASFDDNVSVQIGTGDGAFLPAQDFSVGSSPNGIASADFNGDGKPDLVNTNADDSTVTVLLNTTVAGTVAQGANAGATTLVLVDASAFPIAGAIDVGPTRLSFNGKTGNTLSLVTPLAESIAQWARVTLVGPMGDCNGDGVVTSEDLVTMTSIALGFQDVTDCSLGDSNQDGRILVNEILMAVNVSVNENP